jgi:hypothetical protein
MLHLRVITPPDLTAWSGLSGEIGVVNSAPALIVRDYLEG